MNNVYEIAITGQLDSVGVSGLNILLDVTVTHKLVVPGSFQADAANDLEFYGYSEMDFLITGGEYWDGGFVDGDSYWQRLNEVQLAEVEDKYQSEIEDHLWTLSDKEAFDNVEPNAYIA